MIRKLAAVAVVCLAALLQACSSSVSHPRDTAAPERAPVVLSASRQVADVTISVSEKARQELAENLKFNQATLLDHVKRAVDARGLLNHQPGNTSPTLEIVIQRVRVRSNFSAVMWGFMAGSDSIEGDVVLKSREGPVLDSFRVSASYALGGVAGGQDDARMGWLYEKFAEETIKELTGTK